MFSTHIRLDAPPQRARTTADNVAGARSRGVPCRTVTVRVLQAFAHTALLIAVVFASAPMSQPALAATAVAGSSTSEPAELVAGSLSPQAVSEMVARLPDAQVRALLLERLNHESSPQTEEATVQGVQEILSHSAVRLRRGLEEVIRALPRVSAEVGVAVERLRDGRPPSTFLLIALGFAVMLAVGWALERLYSRSVRGLRARIMPAAQAPTLSARIGLLGVGLLLDLIGIAVFAAGAIAVFFVLWQGHVPTREVIVAFLSAVIVLRIVVAVSRLMLVPASPLLRVPKISDEAAATFHRDNTRIASVATIGLVTCSLLSDLGVSRPVYLLLSYAVVAVVLGLVARAVWRGREAVRADLLGPPETATPVRQVLAAAWPYVTVSFTVIYLGIVIVLSLADVRVGYLAGFGTLLTVHFLPHFDAALMRGSQLLQRRGPEDAVAMSAGRIVVLKTARIFLLAAGVLFLAGLWGADPLAYASGTGVAAVFARTLTDIALTIVVAYVLWTFTCITIDRKLAEEQAATSDDDGNPGPEIGVVIGGAGLSRLATLLPIVRITLQMTILVITGLMVLSALGVNIGPLLAGAGVVGLAVGFGAQTLVRDIVSGIFFLLDDAFRVGEYIDIGTVKGSVEKISVRSVRLRHHRGALNTVPFGEIKRLTNYSRDWAIMKLQFRVPFDADLEKVRKLFKKIGQELLEDEELAPLFLQPFKSQGVVASDDSAWIISGKFMAKPGGQFLIRRKAYAAVQKAFAEAGIDFADRRVTVHVPEAEKLTPEQSVIAHAGGVAAQGPSAQGPSGQ